METAFRQIEQDRLAPVPGQPGQHQIERHHQTHAGVAQALVMALHILDLDAPALGVQPGTAVRAEILAGNTAGIHGCDSP